MGVGTYVQRSNAQAALQFVTRTNLPFVAAKPGASCFDSFPNTMPKISRGYTLCGSTFTSNWNSKVLITACAHNKDNV